jgi:hypothetical protein
MVKVIEEYVIQVLEQAPNYVTELQVRDALMQTDNNIVEAVAFLWNVPNRDQKTEEKPKTKIEEMREYADIFDAEMDRLRKQNDHKGT